MASPLTDNLTFPKAGHISGVAGPPFGCPAPAEQKVAGSFERRTACAANSASLAMLAAMRQASSRVSSTSPCEGKGKPRARRRGGASGDRLLNLLHEPVDRRLVDRI